MRWVCILLFSFYSLICCAQEDDSYLEIKHINRREFSKLFINLVKTEQDIGLELSNNVNPEDLISERKHIPPDMFVSQYIMAEKNLYIFCVTHDSVFAKVVNIGSKELRTMVISMYNLVRYPSFLPSAMRGSKLVNNEKNDNSENLLRETSKKLYKILIDPFKNEIVKKRKLAMIQNSDLSFLPFNALISSDSNNKITYLIDELIVMSYNRLRFIGDASRKKFSSEKIKILAIGNPDKSLPYAESEVKNIKKHFPGTKILLREEATKSNFFSQTDSFNIIHLATHGIFNFKDLDSSYLVMAQDHKNNDNGHLKLYQLKEFYFNNGNKIVRDNYNLLVLSACETVVKIDWNSSSKILTEKTSDQFFKMGIDAIIASFWQVDDKATGILMNNFYENIKTDYIIEALHNAQVDLSKMKGFSHPYYWAPFAYYGR